MNWSLDKTVAVDFDNRRYFDTSNDGKYISFLNTSNTLKVYNTATGEDMGWDIPDCYFLGFKIINSPDSLGGTFLVAIKAGYQESDDTGIIREENDSIIFYKLESGTWVEKGSYQQTSKQESFQIEIVYVKEDGGVLGGRLAWDFEFSEVRHHHVGSPNPIHISEGVNKYLFMVIPSAGNQNPSSGNRHAGSTIFSINTVDGTITKKALLQRGAIPLPNNEILTQKFTSDFYILDLNKIIDIDFDDYVFPHLDGGKDITESAMHVKTLTIDTTTLGADHSLDHLKPFTHARIYKTPSGSDKILGLYKKWLSSGSELGLYSFDYDPVEKTLIANDHMVLGNGGISSPNVRLFFSGETSGLTQISVPPQWDSKFWDQEPPQFLDSSYLNKTIHITDEGELEEVPELQKAYPSMLLAELVREWTQIGENIEGEYSLDNSGHSVSLNSAGDIVAIGAPYNEDDRTESAFKGHGHVRVYQHVNETWTQIGQDINGEAYGDDSGWSTSINAAGNIVAIGAPRNDGINGDNSGHVRVYQYQSTSDTWTKIGQDIDGEVEYDQNGLSTSINAAGDIVAIRWSNTYGDFGYVRVYQYQSDSDTWTQMGEDIGDLRGRSVSLNSDGTIVAIGAHAHHGINGEYSGTVQIFQYQSTSDTWTQIGQDIDGEAFNDRSGQSVSLNSAGNIVIIGAPKASPNDIRNSGHVWVYQYQNASDTWKQIGQNIEGENVLDSNGSSVSINSAGNIIAIGASSNDDGGSYAGYTRIFKLLPD